MNVIILIPILNPDEKFFTELIPKLLLQNIKSTIILINSGDTITHNMECTIIDINKKDFNHANTRNMILQFEADFYLFMTQDATPYDDMLINNLIDGFSDENIVVSYARQLPYENAHITERFARETNYPVSPRIQSKAEMNTLGIKTFFSSDSCAMYKSSYFKKVGGFQKDLNCSEDMEFASRAILDDKKISYTAKACVYHSHLYTFSSLYQRYFLIGEFFKENPWIQNTLPKNNKTEKTGMYQVINEFKYILKKEPLAFPKAFVFNLIKFVAYKMGKKT